MISPARDELKRVVRALAEAGTESPANRGEWVATPVGRNDVWKLTPRVRPGEPRFVKFYRSPVDYRREMRGLNLARKLANGRDWLMAADILIADETGRFLVTDALPGTSLRELVLTALRLGVPRRRQEVALEQARRCLALLVEWVGLLQLQALEAVEDLQDDRPAAVARRIAEKESRLWGDRPRTPLAAPGSPRLVVLTHGDLSFGNVFYHEGRIGIVDFENMGIGLSFRDPLWIRYGLEQCNYRWYYRNSAPLLDLVDAPVASDPLAALYRMEFTVDHLLILKGRQAARPWSGWPFGFAERRWARCEYRRLSRLLASG